jgi:hypothetical protein
MRSIGIERCTPKFLKKHLERLRCRIRSETQHFQKLAGGGNRRLYTKLRSSERNLVEIGGRKLAGTSLACLAHWMR